MRIGSRKSGYSGVYICIVFLMLGIVMAYSARAQHVRDTLRFRYQAHRHVVLSDSALNAIGIDSLLNKIENVHFALNRINSVTSIGFDTRDIEHNFPGVDSSIDIISANMQLYTRVLDIKNLQLFDVMLSDIQGELNQWRATLTGYNKQLGSMRDELISFERDTILRSLMADSSFGRIYGTEINSLRTRWKQGWQGVGANISRISRMQSELSNEYFEAIELQTQVRELLRKGGIKSHGKEYPYLWELRPASAVKSNQNDSLSRESYNGQRRILKYYFMRKWDDQLWMVAIGVLFILWVHRSYRKIWKSGKTELLTDFHPRYISPVPVLPTLVVMLTIAPFFNFHPPTAYVSIMQFLLITVLTLLFWRHWHKDTFKYWLVIGALFIAFSFTGILLTPGLFSRLMLLSVNVFSIFFGILWLRKIRKFRLNFSKMIRFVSLIYLVLNVSAALFNLFGRLSLAKIFSITGIYSLTQVIGLSTFIEVVVEATHLQTKVNKSRGGIVSRINFSVVKDPVRRILEIVAIYVWTVVFTVSLNIYTVLVNEIFAILTTPRRIGSTTFKFGNVLLFMLILYVSNQLQKAVGSLYGSSNDSWDPAVRKNASRLAIMRLTLIVIGFLIAVAASGLPVDKITIVLGALGVGIGLGLQGIVNNFVSGIILIFEQPFRIGDYIELGDKKGRVLDIGIRSSKLRMEEGAEVILPNADLLSGRVINWTLHNDNVRIDMPLTIESDRSFDEVKKEILDIINSDENILKDRQSEVLLASITEKSMAVHVLAWVTNVNRVQSIRGELLNKLHSQLTQKGIHLM